MEEREYVLILSDIHMGTAVPTVWYQKEVHEKYLSAILDEIIVNANKIQEVILLGDIFDFWSYPPSMLAPKMENIIAAHPNILGPTGKLRKALWALKGRMVFVPGDHDMKVTQTDLNKLKSSEGYTIKYHPDSYIPYYDNGILFTHGHTFTLLNAPYCESKLAPLPIAYFITRAMAFQVQNELNKSIEPTVAHCNKFGVYGFDDFFLNLPSKIKNYSSGADFISKLLDMVAEMTGIPKNLKIPVNEMVSVSLNEAKEIYKNLLYDFPKFFQRCGMTDPMIRVNALTANFDKECLPWYVENALGNYIDIIVMGHTHYPVSAGQNGRIEYVNTGFMCPALPDISKNPITYGIYKRSKRFVSLLKVFGNDSNLHPST